MKQAVRSHHHCASFAGWKRTPRPRRANSDHTSPARGGCTQRTGGFLTLEASGWKGRERTCDGDGPPARAFAREAVNRLAERDMCRIHTLTLDDEPIASLVVFVEAGMAYTWKTAYDENYSTLSPGTLLMIEVTKQHLDDPNIMATDLPALFRIIR